MQIRSPPAPRDGKTPPNAGRKRDHKPGLGRQPFDGARYSWPGATLRANLLLDNSMPSIVYASASNSLHSYLAATSKAFYRLRPEGATQLSPALQRWEAVRRTVVPEARHRQINRKKRCYTSPHTPNL